MSNSGERARIGVLATLDTKGPEARYVADRLETSGLAPVLIDMSLQGESPVDAAVTRTDLAARGALDATGDDRTAAMESTADAIAVELRSLLDADHLDGVIGIGGGTGGWMAQRAMETLPLGFPRIIVTTVVKPSGEHDILFLPSVVDVAGLNALLRPVLRNAADAMAGMVTSAANPGIEPADRPVIAMTMFGVTTAGGDVARQTLEEAGYDVVVFHATGAGGRTMERLIADGRFTGVLDWTTTEIVQNIAGGLCDAGPHRLEAAAAAGVPQVIVPGAIDVVNVLPPIPAALVDRAHHWHLPTVPLIRASASESAAAGRRIGDILSAADSANAVALIPEGGFSSLDVAGGVFHDLDAKTAFIDALRPALGGKIPLITSPRHINDPAFAREAAQLLISLVRTATRQTKE